MPAVDALTWQVVREALAERIAAKGLSIGQLAKTTGLSRSTIQKAIGGVGDTQWNTAVRLLTGLGLDLRWVQKNC